MPIAIVIIAHPLSRRFSATMSDLTHAHDQQNKSKTLRIRTLSGRKLPKLGTKLVVSAPYHGKVESLRRMKYVM